MSHENAAAFCRLSKHIANVERIWGNRFQYQIKPPVADKLVLCEQSSCNTSKS
jgi:hypothetical protein